MFMCVYRARPVTPELTLIKSSLFHDWTAESMVVVWTSDVDQSVGA